MFNVRIRSDSYGRRLTINKEPQKRTKFLLTMGCSYVFGEGLNDEGTMASSLARKMPDYMVYNYGVPGASPVQMWQKASQMDLRAEIPEAKGTAIYFLYAFQLQRLLGSMKWLRYTPLSVYGPWLAMNKNEDDVEIRGRLIDRKILLGW